MAAMPRVPRTCADCGAEYSTTANNAAKTPRCPKCRKAYRVECARQRDARLRAERDGQHDAWAHYRPVHGDDWPRGSRFTVQEVRAGIECRAFELDTLFENVKNGKTYRIAAGRLAPLFQEER